MNYILIDGSYFVYFRYHSLCTWWRFSKQENETEIPMENERFRDKFSTTFVSALQNLQSNLNIAGDATMIVGLDCPKEEVWRNEHIEQYKGNRKSNDDVRNAFQMTFDEELFRQGGCVEALSAPKLEADDCLAITTKEIIACDAVATIWLITSDMDYLQLAAPRVHIIDLKMKSLTDNPKWFGDAEKDLFCKIVAGDKSDNIPSVFPRCGLKTAAKYYANRTLFEKKLNEVDGARERYNRNKLIIDFRKIPIDLSVELRSNIVQLLAQCQEYSSTYIA